MSRILLLAILIACPAGAQVHPTPRFDLHAERVDILRRSLDSLAAEDAPGFSLLVGTPDTILVAYQAGLRDLDPGAPIERSTPFYIASVAKTITVFGILRLAERDRLEISSLITDYVSGLPDFMNQITLYHLLTHTSGIPDYYDQIGDERPLTSQRVLEFARSIGQLEFAPGYDYAYSNTAYVLLSMVIERVSGTTYADFMESEFFEPLGMEHSTVVRTPSDVPTDAAVGYVRTEDGAWQKSDYEGIYTTGGGGIYSTVDDLYRWYLAILRFEVVSESSLRLALSMPVTLGGKVSYIGMGWFNETFGRRTPRFQGVPVYAAIGNLMGFRSLLALFPEQDLVFILLSNAGSYPLGLYQVAQALFLPSRR